MAISARSALLAEQRSRAAGIRRFGGSLRVTPAGSLAASVSTIAKKTVETQLKDMTDQYNAGQVSNTDMRNFLTGLQSNTLLTDAERLDVQSSLRDFDNRIREEKLTAVYKNAPDNSIQKIQAAQALANFHQSVAATYQPDTPAQSAALEKAGQWSQQAQSEQQQMETQNRKLRRAQLFNEVANTEPNSIEEAQMKAQAYYTLAQQAQADGDLTEALNFQTQGKNVEQSIPDLQNKLERKDIIGTINQIANLYHDGQITADQFAQAIPELESRAVNIGDTSIQLSLNTWADKLAKDSAKGVKQGTFNGLPVVLGKGQGGGSGISTNWDKQDFDYSDNVRLAEAMFRSGKWDVNTYEKAIAQSIEEHAAQVDQRVQDIYNIAQENPNTKVTYNGKKQRAVDVLDQLYKEQEDMAGQIDAFQTGKFGVVLQDPREFNKSGDPLASGKSLPTFKLVNTDQIPQDQYVQDSQGIYHKILMRERPMTLEEQAQETNGVLFDVNGKPHKVRVDSAGNYFVQTGERYTTVYDGTSSNSKEIPITDTSKPIPTYADVVKAEKQQQVKTGNQVDKLATQTQQTPIQTLTPKQTQLTPTQQPITGVPTIAPVTPTPLTPQNEVVKNELLAAKPTEPVVPKIVGPSKPYVSQAPQPLQAAAPEKVGITTGTKIQMPQIVLPKPTDVAYRQPVSNPNTLSIAGAVKPSPVQNLGKVIGPQKIQGIQGLPTPPKPNPNDNIINLIKSIPTRIFSFFGGKR